jgi:hypothetical protein
VFEREDATYLGRFMALSGNTLAIGSSMKIWVYVYSLSRWRLQHEINLYSDNSDYVRSLALEGDILLVGGTRAVYPYARTGSRWEAEAEFAIEGASIYEGEGFLVALSYPWLAVGAPAEIYGGEIVDEGAVYLFKHQESEWILEDRLGSPRPGSNIEFGRKLAIDGDYMFVSTAWGTEAYLFGLLGEKWLRLGSGIAPPEVEWVKFYGHEVAVDTGDDADGGMLLMGVAKNQGHFPEGGLAFVYDGLIPPHLDPIDPEHFNLLAKMLIGVTGGGGGLVWIPGEGIVPIDPDPYKFLENLSPAERDVVIGLAVRQLADMADNAEVRASLEAAGNRAMEEALQALKSGQTAR